MSNEIAQKVAQEKEENWKKVVEQTEEVLNETTAQLLQNNEEIRKLKEKLAIKELQIKNKKLSTSTQGTLTSFSLPWELSLVIDKLKQENFELTKQLKEEKEQKGKAIQRI